MLRYHSCIRCGILVYIYAYVTSFAGFSSLLFDSTGTRLFASCTDDVIYQYDFINYSPIPGVYTALLCIDVGNSLAKSLA